MQEQSTERAVRNISMEAAENDGRYDNNQKDDANKSNNVFDTKNYLNVKLDTDNGELSKELRIRILPIDKDSDKPFKIVHMHTLKVPKEISKSGWKSYVCLEKTKDDIDHERLGHKCPFCEANREAYEKFQNAKTDPEKELYKTESLANKASRVGILRCIERGHEEDGPKFWKFNLRQDEDDPMGKITKLVKTRNQESISEGDGPFNLLDIYEGKDILVTVTAAIDDKTKKPTGKTSISITDYGKIKPLSNNEEDIDKWVNDSKKWSDVFVAKTYEYLSIVHDGGIPWYDRNQGIWVPKVDFNAKKNEDAKQVDKDIANAEKALNTAPKDTMSDDGLPF